MSFKRIILFLVACLGFSVSFAQKKLPYKTLSQQQVFDIYNTKQDFIFLDVRSKGEYFDTTARTGLRLGHINGAINIPVQELGKRMDELRLYQHKKIIVYCSHSYRSRRASNILADSGFTQIYNMNNGISAMYRLDRAAEDYAPGIITRATKYRSLSPAMFYNMLKSDKEIMLLEVTGNKGFMDSVFRDVYGLMGSFENAQKLSMVDLKSNAANLEKYKSRTIIVYSASGNGDAEAAEYLTNNGFDQVYYLFDGLLAWYNYISEHNLNELQAAIKPYRFVDRNTFHFISVAKACDLLQTDAGLVLDVRTANAFNDTSRGQVYKYTHLKNSINIPAAAITDHAQKVKLDKEKEIIVVDETLAPDMHVLQTLVQDGYHVSYMPMGLNEWELSISNDADFKCKDMMYLY